MNKLQKQVLVDFIGYLPLWLFLQIIKILPVEARCLFVGWLAGALCGLFKKRTAQTDKNLRLIFPDMTAEERRVLRHKIACQTGRVGCAMVNARGCNRLHHRLHATGDGLVVLRQEQAKGKGALLLSAHIGQWDSPRIYLRSQGMEVGALVRPMAHPFVAKLLIDNLKITGEPIALIGRTGTSQTVRALKQGRIIAILSDQRQNVSPILPFMGHGAKTSLAPARMALKLNLPLVTVFTRVAANKRDIYLDFQAPIAPSTPEQMMTEFNQRLEEKIRANPEQWHWLHDRWQS